MTSGAAGAPIPGALPAGAVGEVETDVGTLFFHVGDRVMAPVLQADHRWEPEESDFLRAAIKPGTVFLDVGAYIGYMSLLGAAAVGPAGTVISIEPEERNVALLKANLWRNGARSRVYAVAAYSRTGYVPLILSDENRGDHQVNDSERGDVLVPCARMDALLEGTRVDVVKIDTQGVDHEVVEGMAGLLAANPAMVALVEFWLEGMESRGTDPERVLDGYRRRGFTVKLLTEGGRSHPSTDRDVVAACEAWGGRYVNLVLEGPAAPGARA